MTQIFHHSIFLLIRELKFHHTWEDLVINQVHIVSLFQLINDCYFLIDPDQEVGVEQGLKTLKQASEMKTSN